MSLKRFVASSALSNYLEFFDFTLFAFCIHLIAHLYFPNSDPRTSVLLAWGIFAISFAIRPVGALFWGYIGDHYGRRFALSNSIVVMSVTTMLCGLIPTYSYWGIFAPITFIGLRLLQGFSLSAEYNGGSIYIIENAKKYKGLLCSLSSFSCGLGILTGSFVMMLLTAGYSSDDLPQWRWRLPFIVGGLLIGATSYFLRRNMQNNNINTTNRLKNPIGYLLKNEKTALFRNFCATSYNGVCSYVIYTYVSSYLQTHLAISVHNALKYNTIASLISITSALIFGHLSDRLGRKNIMFFAALAMFILVFPMFHLINTGQPFDIVLGLGCLAICAGAFGGPMNAGIAEMFSLQNRYTGTSLGYNLGMALVGGTSPFVISLLLNVTGNLLIVPLYLILFASLAMVMTFVFRQKHAALYANE